jgi:hypothetical protein
VPRSAFRVAADPRVLRASMHGRGDVDLPVVITPDLHIGRLDAATASASVSGSIDKA